jgi:dTDP-4-amino-4,6-dideoxygalactose transaminase
MTLIEINNSTESVNSATQQQAKGQPSPVPHVEATPGVTKLAEAAQTCFAEARPDFGSWPSFSTQEIAAVSKVLASGKVNYWTGTECREFEKEYASKLGVNHAIALANGTVALELALYALGVGPGDEVIVTPRSFIASVSCIVMRGATPVFADVDRESQNITLETIEPKVTARTKAIILVHLAGWPCEMDPILEFAKSKSIAVVEDCAQAHGSFYKGRASGSIGDINAFSFCQDKIMTTGGEGGLVTTNSRELWEKAWAFKDHGKSFEAVYNRSHPPGFRWLHEDFGTNWRMLEIQGVLGRQCLTNLDQWVEIRRRHAATLNAMLADQPAIRLTIPPVHIQHSYYKYYAFVRPEALKSDWNRDRILAEVSSAGITCLAGSCSEMYREKAFARNGLNVEPLPVATELGATSVLLLVHPTLTQEAIEYSGETLRTVLRRATR